MTTPRNAVAAIGAALLSSSIFLIACTGGTESNAAEEQATTKSAEAQKAANVDGAKAIALINAAIPIYAGAQFNDDLTRRDAVAIRNQFGPQAEVYTLATDDSYPQVFHYYTTFLAQYRAFPAQDTYPSQKQNWRTMEVQLNQAMQDPFIPGQAMNPTGKQVMLQIAETEAEPKTVIRYIVTPAGVPLPATATAVTSSPATSRPSAPAE